MTMHAAAIRFMSISRARSGRRSRASNPGSTPLVVNHRHNREMREGEGGCDKKTGSPVRRSSRQRSRSRFATADQAAVPTSGFELGRFLSPLNVRKITSHSGELTP